MPLNLKAAVLHVNSTGKESTSPTMRIARYAAYGMEIPLIHDLETAKRYERHAFDVLFVKHGMLKFSQHRDYCLAAYAQAKVIVELQNDYTFKADSRFLELDREKELRPWVWGTVRNKLILPGDQYVNWNMLTWLPPVAWANELPLPEYIRKGIIYYGAHRADRIEYFKKYFHDAPYPVTISTFRGRKAFRETCGDTVAIMGALRTPALLAQWQATVYIEDKTSHTLYCSPANRFYECVQMGVAQAIDAGAVPTLEKAGFTVSNECIVDSKKELRAFLKDSARQQVKQRKLWHRNFFVDLRLQLKAACRASFGTKCGM